MNSGRGVQREMWLQTYTGHNSVVEGRNKEKKRGKNFTSKKEVKGETNKGRKETHVHIILHTITI
jgi:uncharacterized protein YktA (UPF0223 family)